MLQILAPTDRGLAALLRYVTAPIADEPPIPIRGFGQMSGVRYQERQMLVLAARSPMTLGAAEMVRRVNEHGADIVFTRIRDDEAVTVDLAMRHLGGVEIVRAMRPCRWQGALWLAAPKRELWASLTGRGIGLCAQRPWTAVQDLMVRADAASEIAAIFAGQANH